MEFSCSVCQYTSDKKENTIRHINRKVSCGTGIKEIIEIPIDIFCNHCKKIFSSSKTLKYHLKNNCKAKDNTKDDEIKKLKERTKELEIKLLKSTQHPENTTEEKRNSMYLIQEREFFNLKQPVYKLGITETIHNRMGHYPRGSKIICVIPVDGDPEALCLVKFRSLFTPRIDIGSEYFEGNQDEMVKILIECCT